MSFREVFEGGHRQGKEKENLAKTHNLGREGKKIAAEKRNRHGMGSSEEARE